MAEGEEEVHYASGVFKAGNNPPPAAKRAEETVYVEVKVQNETKNEAKRGEETVYDEVKVQNETKNEAKRGEETVYGEVKVQKETKNEDSAGHRRFQHLACCLGILCVILLGGIIGVCVFLATLSHESDPNRFKENSTLRANNTKLSFENANLTTDNKNLADQLGNLTQAYTVSESNNKNLSAGVQELNTRNQELETEKKNLKQQIQNMTTNWNELNVSRAQWSIDSYCLGNTNKKCQACQKGWGLTGLSCYAYNNPQPPNRKTWEEAREDCKGKNSDLAVAHNPAEKEAINEKSFGSNGFWIGLRVVNKKWEWVDGSNLTDSSWIAAPVEGHCAVFYNGRDIWSSVSCDKRKQWICQKKALSV
ncbi:C-type lectin domain family 12 member B-like isoform X2 [Trematomus bernacchii]|uniref:C-type lectin domain family 12 member B-like isoform X2 n=1 Tax=Trematomus bernacchii TaxID=40690 RepID=UPI00146C69A5|nr:C-type lectin domain family 12 member B-like isoform X2 [Trematomus bernacchii]